VAGDAGRAAVAFLGTSVGTPGQDPFTTGFHGVWYLYVSYTYDGGATWHTVQADPEPVQRGEIDAGGTTTTGQRNLLDFMDANLTKDGRVVVAYADGCLDVCNTSAGTEAESTNQYATVAYQSTGEGMFSAYDVVPTAAPDAPTLAVAGATTPSLSWTTPNDENSPITGYRISRATAPGQETVIGTVAAGTTTFADQTAAAGATYYYRVAAVNAVGVGDPSNEVSATTSSAPATTVPSAPTLAALAGKAAVTLTWTTPSDGGSPITGWAIYRATTSGGERIIQTLSSGTSYVDTTVTGATTYFYEVAAINANGTGAPSREVSVTPKKGK
jgi:fibronectin type 3 domain-containing protein